MRSGNTWHPDESKVIPEDDLAKLLKVSEALAGQDVAEGRRVAVMRWATVNIACLAGLRVSEIAALKVSDIRVGQRRPCLKVRRGKGGKSRTIPLVGPLSGLRDVLHRLIQWKKAVGEGTAGEDPLLVSNWLGKQKHYTTDALKGQFKGALARAGIRTSRFSVHCGRHSAATYLYARTRNLRLVQNILGHSSPTVTAGYAAIVDGWQALEEAGDSPLAGEAVGESPHPSKQQSRQQGSTRADQRIAAFWGK